MGQDATFSLIEIRGLQAAKCLFFFFKMALHTRYRVPSPVRRACPLSRSHTVPMGSPHWLMPRRYGRAQLSCSTQWGQQDKRFPSILQKNPLSSMVSVHCVPLGW